MKYPLTTWMLSLWQQGFGLVLRSPEVGQTPDWGQYNAEAALKETMERMQREHNEQLATARAAAAAGTGPQPWDKDWIENNLDHSEDMAEMICRWGWHDVNDLREALVWALASPQGQRAQALAENPSSPWEGPLQLIHELQRVLDQRVDDLLCKRARKLGLDEHWASGGPSVDP